MKLQMFADGVTVSTDLEPAISVDFVNRITTNIDELRQLLTTTDMQPMNTGTLIKMYKMALVNTPEQVAEGEEIGLTEVKQELVDTIELTLNKFRKQTTAEAIQKVGQDVAVNKTDAELISSIQSSIKKAFYATIAKGTGTATPANEGLQGALAAGWGALTKYYEDKDATPIHFVPSDDLADYLGGATISMQTAFGLSYIEDFLGLGTVVVSPALESGTVYSTAKENLNGAYVPASSGDVASSFGLTSDATGLVGMTHAAATANASIETLIMSGVVFFPEMLDGVIATVIEGN
ncbi:MAG: hypothetical protein LUD72_11490 [Bacteroidales bacterium]|nr:hypothetical protein [Bacteroidales bacterium]